ncbi:response regulator transcription factor [Paenibacillus thalictri]|uniref:Heme response regulator HssR n=1 Tax=Paenibacillus thalictri TaxID=2527873 RepID=A0A4Q9DI75_9BACL|nr:response regulator transcription factor [Paenibacillus thalictri]TBL70786.1 response regulator transcription factor [Paenibacillus thalictri]
MASILIVDDDRNIRELIKVYLIKESYMVFEAGNGVAALALLEKERVDLVVLDIMMPQMDGWELCREIKRTSDLPVLMVTAKGEAAHKIKGFQLGTDDYIVKPFDPQELVLRVRALLKRYRISISQSVSVGDLHMNRSTYDVMVGSERMLLPLKEFELLFKLTGTVGHIFTREQLIEQIWGSDYEGDERTVDVHIKRLRERLAGKTNTVKITTVRGIGYRLEMCDE